MKKKKKLLKSFRLSEETLDYLDFLSHITGHDLTTELEIAINNRGWAILKEACKKWGIEKPELLLRSNQADSLSQESKHNNTSLWENYLMERAKQQKIINSEWIKYDI